MNAISLQLPEKISFVFLSHLNDQFIYVLGNDTRASKEAVVGYRGCGETIYGSSRIEVLISVFYQ